ncbi:unnamed protein product [Miscanthus lutarioriparius]|uniref:Uncharacterized protein n=1 Tax=Miscanthus lutarioriparius TaxID=422564 RepID=A0A811RXU3_9POAL|nr:unnamed protein product [Miscanthus lutarioriparius]
MRRHGGILRRCPLCPDGHHPLPAPTSLRTFLHRRFACAAVASAASALATVSLLRVWGLSDFADMLAVFGVRKDHLDATDIISPTTENTLIPSSIVVILFGDDLLTRRRLLRSWFSGHA